MKSFFIYNQTLEQGDIPRRFRKTKTIKVVQVQKEFLQPTSHKYLEQAGYFSWCENLLQGGAPAMEQATEGTEGNELSVFKARHKNYLFNKEYNKF